MRTTLPALCLLLLCAACGEPAHTIEFRMSPGQEAVIRVTDADGLVTLRNEGASPFDVFWPAASSPARVAPGASSGRTLAGEVFVKVCPPPGLGGRGAVVVQNASGLMVSTVNVSPPATPTVVR